MPGTLRDQLDKAIDGKGSYQIEDGERRAEVEVHDADRIGVVVDRVKVTGGEPTDVGRRAEHIAERVRPGGERLVPVEVVPDMGGGVLRTDPERIRDGRFYQVDVDERGAELTRQRKGDDGQRSREPFSVTREQLGEIVDGLGWRPEGEE